MKARDLPIQHAAEDERRPRPPGGREGGVVTTQHTVSPQTALEWDVRSWSPALRLWDRLLAERSVDNTLELGARGGGLSLWLSERSTYVVCSDVFGTDLADAVHLHGQAGARNIFYRSIDARFIPFVEACDLIVFRSVIGALGKHADQARAIDSMWGALRPGGMLLFAENLYGTELHALMRQRFNPWSRNWLYPTLDELSAYLRIFRAGQIHTTGVVAALGRREWQRSALAVLDQRVLNHLVPFRSRTIAYGWAVK